MLMKVVGLGALPGRGARFPRRCPAATDGRTPAPGRRRAAGARRAPARGRRGRRRTPTLVMLATATTSAIASTRSSPARQSRSSMRQRLLHRAGDPARHQADDPAAALREVLVVRHHHERGAEAAVQLEHQLDHALARLRVEAAGRLVGEQQLRPHREGARQRHALLLAAGQVLRIVRQALAAGPTAGKNFRATWLPHPRAPPVPAAASRSRARSAKAAAGTTGTRSRPSGRAARRARPRPARTGPRRPLRPCRRSACPGRRGSRAAWTCPSPRRRRWRPPRPP